MNTSFRGERFQTVCLFILTLIAIAGALHWLRPVMIPFVLAMFFSLMLTPLLDIQMKYLRSPRSLALITTIVLGVILLVLLWLVITASISQIIQNTDIYQQKIDQFFDKAVGKADEAGFGIDVKGLLLPLVQDISKNASGMIKTVINAIVGILSQGVLVLIFTMFLLIGKKSGPRPLNADWLEGERRIKRYIVTKVFISALTGFLVGFMLMLLGVDLAILFGLLAFILNFIPSVGSIIATLLPLPVILVSPDISLLRGVLAIALPGSFQFLIGNILEPKIMGDILNLHPVAILMALIFWGMIWGIVGMLLAVPLTAIMQIIFSRIEFTTPIANLLAGRLDEL